MRQQPNDQKTYRGQQQSSTNLINKCLYNVSSFKLSIVKKCWNKFNELKDMIMTWKVSITFELYISNFYPVIVHLEWGFISTSKTVLIWFIQNLTKAKVQIAKAWM